jgi:hypothetical protein
VRSHRPGSGMSLHAPLPHLMQRMYKLAKTLPFRTQAFLGQKLKSLQRCAAMRGGRCNEARSCATREQTAGPGPFARPLSSSIVALSMCQCAHFFTFLLDLVREERSASGNGRLDLRFFAALAISFGPKEAAVGLPHGAPTGIRPQQGVSCMFRFRWIRQLFSVPTVHRLNAVRRIARPSVKPRLESLENRELPSANPISEIVATAPLSHIVHASSETPGVNSAVPPLSSGDFIALAHAVQSEVDSTLHALFARALALTEGL